MVAQDAFAKTFSFWAGAVAQRARLAVYADHNGRADITATARRVQALDRLADDAYVSENL
ncbi:hypothetical protein Acor_14690 [Acrocarpospora corrugata]|uniref:Uncharacterized protein n=1 Tax=Acrocarpospora corrugata TaxID=35763 RepID=A0A5M3VRT9_9ACTN|nr:hypothetical protein Acor_14690 [Acrocarpospora corrugata]